MDVKLSFRILLGRFLKLPAVLSKIGFIFVIYVTKRPKILVL